MQADGESVAPTISADERWVAFRSRVTNLPGGTTGLVSVAHKGTPLSSTRPVLARWTLEILEA